MWETILTVLTSIMPIIQGFTDDQTQLGLGILRLVTLETDPKEGNLRRLPRLERLRGNLRLMFSLTSGMRSEALSQVAWYLSKEEKCAEKRPSFSELSLATLADIYYVDSPRHLEADFNTVTVFSVGDISSK